MAVGNREKEDTATLGEDEEGILFAVDGGGGGIETGWLASFDLGWKRVTLRGSAC